jgi:hypothetical protein
MARVTRQVDQTYDAAKGRAVAHLDEATLTELGIEPGDSIAIEGDERTVVAAARQRNTDPSDTVRIDGFTRNNAGVQPHESVDIEPVETNPAESVTVRPPKPLCCPIGSDHDPFVTNELLGTPTLAGERLWVMVGPQQPFGVVVGSWRPLDVIATDTDGPAVVTESTDISIESAIDDVESGGTAGETESWDALRESVFERDGRACRNCGVDFDTGSATLEAHFIITPHHGGTVDTGNLVTLCRKCHVTAHQHVTTPSV